MNRIRLGFFVAVILVAVGFWFLLQNENLNLPRAGTPGAESAKFSLATALRDTVSGSENPERSSPKEATPPGAVSESFKNWLQQEAKNLEKSAVDPNVKEVELKVYAAQLGASEILFLRDRAMDFEQTSANDRILAVYLLTLAPQHHTKGALLELTQAPLKLQGEHSVHSLEETLAAQEKSLRRMAIDQLVAGARGDEQSRSELVKQFAQIQDVSLREYAQKALLRNP